MRVNIAGSQPPSLLFGKDSKAERPVGKFYSENRDGFRYALIGGHPCGEAGDGLTRNQASYVIGLAFSGWSCVGSRGEM